MGQPIGVTVRDTLDSRVRVFETDRWLTGMGSGMFETRDEAPEGTMARLLFDMCEAEAVHVYGSCLTVTLGADGSWGGLEDKVKEALEQFYIFYRDGVVPEPAAVPEPVPE